MYSKKTLKEAFLQKLKQNAGIIAPALQINKKQSISRQTFYNWCGSDPAFAAAVDEIIQTQVDFVESRLLKNIQEGDPQSIIFYLKTKARGRGYSDRREVELTGIPPTQVIVSSAEVAQVIRNAESGKE